MKNTKKTVTAVCIAIAILAVIIIAVILGRHLLSVISARLTGDDSYEDWEDEPQNSDDWLYEDYEYGTTIYAFQKDGQTYLVNGSDIINTGETLEDGCFYKIKADAKILNGGVAGYYNYPEIERVISCEEISPLDMDLPSITEQRYGLILIGDYADGDVLLNDYYDIAVWKDGEWVWHYDDRLERDDGTMLLFREGVSEEEAQNGIESGVLACEDYMLLPSEE